jgi:beta-lactam-binding protein with PASTA domain
VNAGPGRSGRVLAQAPAANTPLPKGSLVAITIGQ